MRRVCEVVSERRLITPARFKGTWQTEGGGALINQAIHQVDLLRWFAGPVKRVYGRWVVGAVHRIESEDLVNATLEFASGALGVIQASTALWPGYPERIEIHGVNGGAIITGDRLSNWGRSRRTTNDALGLGVVRRLRSHGDLARPVLSASSATLIDAHGSGRQPLVSAQDGINALEIVEAIYQSCRTGQPVEWA